MTGSGQRPLLFLDVDGPLIPFGAPSGQYPIYLSDLDSPAADTNPLLARANPGHGPRLAALPCDLVWATTWAAEANECLSPRMGLPPLPVVDWPEPSEFEEQDARNGLHWKTRALVDWAAGLPFVWVDDEITDTDREWVRTHHPASALLHRVDPQHGLVDADYTALAEWLKRLTCIAADACSVLMARAEVHTGEMDGSDTPKTEWVVNLPSGPPEKEALAHLVDSDGGRDDAENSYYEAFADPDFVRVETTQRRFRGQYLRRLRRLAARHDHRHLTD